MTNRLAEDTDTPASSARQILVADQRPAVTAALVLGWRLAELYDRDALPPPTTQAADTQVPQHLPGASEMNDHEHALVLLGQASTAQTSLKTLLGIDLPGVDGIRAALDQPGHHRNDVRQEILDSYIANRNALLGAAPSAATSYGLGRLLADTTRLPRSHNQELFLERFNAYRLANAYSWLDDLATVFPPRAAAAVRASLQAWQNWVGSQQKHGGASLDAFDEDVLRALHRQGEMWRRLLSGEKDPLHLLGSEDYVAAGERLLQRGRQITQRFVRKWWPVIAVFLAFSSAAIWAALTYAPAGSDRLAAVLVTAAATLGLSWKGIGATLGAALKQAENALWASEVDAATEQAATILPRKQRRTGRPALADSAKQSKS